MFSWVKAGILALCLFVAGGCATLNQGLGGKAFPLESKAQLLEAISDSGMDPTPVPGACGPNTIGAVAQFRVKEGSYRLIALQRGENMSFILLLFDEVGKPSYVWGVKVAGDKFIVKDASSLDEWLKKYGEDPCKALTALMV